jgi:maltose alpha-D-glucosyltransferase/alpha-amylase
LRHWQGETILALHNLAGSPQQVDLNLAIFAGIQPRDLLAGEELPFITPAPYGVTLPAYGYRWWLLDRG